MGCKYRANFQRAWNVGNKFDESRCDILFPLFNANWVAFPARRRRVDIRFKPKAANEPVGNAEDYSALSLTSVWLKMFGKAAAMACQLTNPIGLEKFGVTWEEIDLKSMLQFHCCLFRMAIARRSTLTSYFCRTDGDAVIRSIGMSRAQFLRIYQVFTLYDRVEAKARGWSDRSDQKNFDSLHKRRPVWNEAMVGFQSMRNPGEFIAADEGMQKYTGTFPHRQVKFNFGQF